MAGGANQGGPALAPPPQEPSQPQGLPGQLASGQGPPGAAPGLPQPPAFGGNFAQPPSANGEQPISRIIALTLQATTPNPLRRPSLRAREAAAAAVDRRQARPRRSRTRPPPIRAPPTSRGQRRPRAIPKTPWP
jgi:glucose repression regulatory protein TUP1